MRQNRARDAIPPRNRWRDWPRLSTTKKTKATITSASQQRKTQKKGGFEVVFCKTCCLWRRAFQLEQRQQWHEVHPLWRCPCPYPNSQLRIRRDSGGICRDPLVDADILQHHRWVPRAYVEDTEIATDFATDFPILS